MPKRNTPGESSIARAFIFIPIVATKIYKKIDPIVDAPAPSYFRNFVNDNTKPPVVEKIINQKNLLFKLNLDNPG